MVPKLKALMDQKCPAMDFDLMLNAMAVDEVFGQVLIPNATAVDVPFKSALASQGSQSDPLLRTIMVAAIGGVVGAVSMYVFVSRRGKIGMPADVLG